MNLVERVALVHSYLRLPKTTLDTPSPDDA